MIVSPAILSSIATFALSNSLDGHAKGIETLQLGRGALLLVLNGSQADMRYKYLLDRLFRQDANQAVRRMAAIVHPQDWQSRMASYDSLVDRDDSDAKTVQDIQAMEHSMVMEAGARLTPLQLRHNIVTGRIAKIESLKTQITAVLASLTSALTIVIFFITNKQKPGPAPSPAAPEKRQRPASMRKRAADDR